MYEENQILTKIEKLVEKLPYRSVAICIELPDKTLELRKEKRNPIGFHIPKDNQKPVD
jgi:hypothetical protein